MTPTEFKSWFDGFTEALIAVPTKAQWARIKERVAEIDGKPTTERGYIDRYYPHYYPQPIPYWSNTWGGAGSNHTIVYNTATALYQLGQADAVSVS